MAEASVAAAAAAQKSGALASSRAVNRVGARGIAAGSIARSLVFFG
jgi:hypothetical protein